ncbi:expressed unknown protein (Partial), partial [Seminavis robusta]|eukprot:Sro3803_g351190.1 n/a (161) ;mRNA; r:20-504
MGILLLLLCVVGLMGIVEGERYNVAFEYKLADNYDCSDQQGNVRSFLTLPALDEGAGIWNNGGGHWVSSNGNGRRLGGGPKVYELEDEAKAAKDVVLEKLQDTSTNGIFEGCLDLVEPDVHVRIQQVGGKPTRQLTGDQEERRLDPEDCRDAAILCNSGAM